MLEFIYSKVEDKFRKLSVECLNLDSRGRNLCKVLKIRSIEELASLPVKKALRTRNLGGKSVLKLRRAIEEFVREWDLISKIVMETPLEVVLEVISEKIPNKKDRECFRKRYIEGKTLREIGEELNITRERVRQRMVNLLDFFSKPHWKELFRQYLNKENLAKLKLNNAKAVGIFSFFSQVVPESVPKKNLDINNKMIIWQRRKIEFVATGKRLKIERILRKLTQKKLANLLGVAKPTINTWEKGKCVPRKVNLQKINKFLGGDGDVWSRTRI